jgi:hypothetical protein
VLFIIQKWSEMNKNKTSDNTFRWSLFTGLFCMLLPTLQVLAQKPVIRVDLNFSGRNEDEINEPGYLPWTVEAGTNDSRTFEGVKVETK